MNSRNQPSIIGAPEEINTGVFNSCNRSSNYKADSHTVKPGSNPELLSATGASNSNLSHCNVAGIVHGDISSTHVTNCNFNISCSSDKETRKYDNDTEKRNHSGLKASSGATEISLTSRRVGTPCDRSKSSIPKGTISCIQEDCSSSSYRPTIGVASPYAGLLKWVTNSFSSTPGTSEPDTDEDRYSCEEVDDFILVSPSDITLQGNVKVFPQDITDGKDLHPTNPKRALIHQEDVNGSNDGQLVSNPPQIFENQIPITSLQEDTESDHLGYIKSLQVHTEPNDNFHLESLLAAVSTIQDPWRAFAEEIFLSLLAVAEKGDVAPVMRIVKFLRIKLIETKNVVHPTANHQSFLNHVKVLQRIRNLSDHVRWRTAQSISYIVNIAQRDPSKMEDIVTFLDDFFLNEPN
ncbi:uncharacterized protein [Haliotis asinina]|uniref:uncharacterized protein isoform X2 n=1 Tax=Haliotis asinina TaxID=109174 RepID=UPI00353192AA